MQSNPRDQYNNWTSSFSSQDSLLSGRGRIGIGIGVLVTAFLLYLLGGGFPPPVWILVLRTFVGTVPTPARFPMLLIQSFILLTAWLILLLVALQVIRPRRTAHDSDEDDINEVSLSSKQIFSATQQRPGIRQESEERRVSPWKSSSATWQAQHTPPSPYLDSGNTYSETQRPSSEAKNNLRKRNGESQISQVREKETPYSAQESSPASYRQDYPPPLALKSSETEVEHQRSGHNDALTSTNKLSQPSSTRLVKDLRQPAYGRSQEINTTSAQLTMHQDSSRANTSMSTFHISAHTPPNMNLEGFRLSGWSLCHPGIQRRHENFEDYLLVSGGLRTQADPQIPFGLFILADGAVIEEADTSSEISTSRLAVNVLCEEILPALRGAQSMDPQRILRLLTESMQQANTSLYQFNQQRQSAEIITMTAILVLGTEAYIVNVGDNRAYLYRIKRSRQASDEGLFQITNDHSSVATQLEQGTLSPEDLFKQPKSEHVYRSLGQQEALNNIDVFSITLSAGDILVLCSDGLWKVVREGVFQQLVERIIQPPIASPSLLCSALTQAALEAGGHDHLSTVVVQTLPL